MQPAEIEYECSICYVRRHKDKLTKEQITSLIGIIEEYEKSERALRTLFVKRVYAIRDELERKGKRNGR